MPRVGLSGDGERDEEIRSQLAKDGELGLGIGERVGHCRRAELSAAARQGSSAAEVSPSGRPRAEAPTEPRSQCRRSGRRGAARSPRAARRVAGSARVDDHRGRVCAVRRPAIQWFAPESADDGRPFEQQALQRCGSCRAAVGRQLRPGRRRTAMSRPGGRRPASAGERRRGRSWIDERLSPLRPPRLTKASRASRADSSIRTNWTATPRG